MEINQLDRIALENRLANIWSRVKELDDEWVAMENFAQLLANKGELAEATKLFQKSENGPRSEARRLRLSAREYSEALQELDADEYAESRPRC